MKKTHVIILLDESSSMSPYRKAVVESFNEYVDDLKNQSRIRVSLYKFSSSIGGFVTVPEVLRSVFENRKVKQAYPITLSQYAPCGMTPLYDAVGGLIKKTKKRLPKEAKVLFVVHTDGQENRSQHCTQETVKTMIRKCEEKRGWTFVYLGEGAAAWNAGYDFGIENVSNFSSGLRGQTMSKLGRVTESYHASSAIGTTKTLYKDAGVSPDDIDPNDIDPVVSVTVTDKERST